MSDANLELIREVLGEDGVKLFEQGKVNAMREEGEYREPPLEQQKEVMQQAAAFWSEPESFTYGDIVSWREHCQGNTHEGPFIVLKELDEPYLDTAPEPHHRVYTVLLLALDNGRRTATFMAEGWRFRKI